MDVQNTIFSGNVKPGAGSLGIMNAETKLFASGRRAFMFFFLDEKESKNQGCRKNG
jgi:hypothetical protein